METLFSLSSSVFVDFRLLSLFGLDHLLRTSFFLCPPVFDESRSHLPIPKPDRYAPKRYFVLLTFLFEKVHHLHSQIYFVVSIWFVTALSALSTDCVTDQVILMVY